MSQTKEPNLTCLFSLIFWLIIYLPVFPFCPQSSRPWSYPEYLYNTLHTSFSPQSSRPWSYPEYLYNTSFSSPHSSARIYNFTFPSVNLFGNMYSFFASLRFRLPTTHWFLFLLFAYVLDRSFIILLPNMYHLPNYWENKIIKCILKSPPWLLTFLLKYELSWNNATQCCYKMPYKVITLLDSVHSIVQYSVHIRTVSAGVVSASVSLVLYRCNEMPRDCELI